jgi:hypothetical protein
MSSMRHFVDDDVAYLGWLADHPDGFVLNTGRNPSAAYLKLHRVSCGSIRGTPARGSTFTGDYSKVCGEREELDAFARQLGGLPKPCGLCLRDHLEDRGARAAGKYGPLFDYVARHGDGQVRMAFAEVEDLAGPLPTSARSDRMWWSDGAQALAQAGRAVGWYAKSVDQAAEMVIFAHGPGGQAGRTASAKMPPPGLYIDRAIAAAVTARAGMLGFDSAKLARLVDELNDSYARGNAYAAHALLRAILDHVPPMLGFTDFKAAANNHSWGKTDKNYARRLLDFKLQADDALHRQISARTGLLTMEDMPPRVWVNRILQECAG